MAHRKLVQIALVGGISETADTHEYHLELIVKKCIEQRGFSQIVDDDPFVDPYPEQPLGYFIVQTDKRLPNLQSQEQFLGISGHSDSSNKASA